MPACPTYYLVTAHVSFPDLRIPAILSRLCRARLPATTLLFYTAAHALFSPRTHTLHTTVHYHLRLPSYSTMPFTAYHTFTRCCLTHTTVAARRRSAPYRTVLFYHVSSAVLPTVTTCVTLICRSLTFLRCTTCRLFPTTYYCRHLPFRYPRAWMPLRFPAALPLRAVIRAPSMPPRLLRRLPLPVTLCCLPFAV